MKNYLKPQGQSVWVTLQYSDVSSDNSHIWPLKYLYEETSRFSKLYFDFIAITLNVESTEKTTKVVTLKYYVV